MSGYCRVAPGHPVHQPYHDREYGFPVADEAVLYERLSLEIFQAGLSWEIVLKKRAALNHAFASFSVDRVAAFDASDLERLLHDAAIIRNRRKIEAVIANAAQIQALRVTSGGFSQWLAALHPRPHEAWLSQFRETFRFMGAEVVREFLLSTGYLPGAHAEDCPIYPVILATAPPWLATAKDARLQVGTGEIP
ncbi:MAG: DNA-3-methyladenine glycosylase I [Defluviicoccus sp.]|nr:DNA-3-methyladenine glycosylase I [Defluviicoccus sp.]MDG4592474.1 DNA-3-methyladenine glycosylase I [Defluviicoccus sp.]MDS4010641.1 DNA-3-methyladenine glycosylase I [Defluviicoccus sp.]MDS4073674.1 DNA-3-methyladenine glycosylase I [Defluviicoccus sp.]